MELELICIRHGRTQWNKEKRYLGHTNMGILIESLTELLPAKEALEGRTFRKIFCSDLKRCRETLEWIYPTSMDSVVFDNRLREMDFGEWEGHTYDELKGSSIYRKWLDNPQSVIPPRGESWIGFQERIADFMDRLACSIKEEIDDKAESSVLIVTHGGVIRQLASITIPGSTFWDFSADPGSLLSLKLTLHEGHWTGHL